VGRPPAVVRAVAAYELALGIAALVWPVVSPLLAVTYAGLAALTFSLSRRAASCGCFGEGDAPASVAQSALSLVLAIVAALPAHAGGWILERPASTAVVLVAGIAAAAYGTVVAYAEVPLAWSAWSGPR
jgi:hypothetical protein